MLFFRAVSINVYLGAHNINALSESSRVMYTTKIYYQNPGWLQQNVNADIALVKLDTPINIIGNFFFINLYFLSIDTFRLKTSMK